FLVTPVAVCSDPPPSPALAYAVQVAGIRGIDQLARAVRSHPLGIDLVMAVVLCSATLLTTAIDPRQSGGTLTGPAVLVAVAAYGALLCRRRWPIPALAVTTVAAALYMTLSSSHGWVMAAPLIALFHLAGWTADRRVLLVAGGLPMLILVSVPTL